MRTVRPFQAYLPAAELVTAVVTPPLGGLTARQWMQLSHDNRLSFLHVIRSEIDSVRGGPDPAVPDTLGRDRLDEMIADGVLRAGPAAAFYIYAIDDGGNAAVGIVAQVHVDAYRTGRVRRHEDTRASTEALLLDHLERVGAQSDPVALTFSTDEVVAGIIAKVRETGEATLDFIADDGTHQRVWTIDDPDTVALLERRLSAHALYITDGHHRCAAAVRYAEERHANDPNPPAEGADEDYDYFLAVLYADHELTLNEFNRCVAETGRSAEEIVAAVGEVVALEEPTTVALSGPGDLRPAKAGKVTLVAGGRAWGFTLPEAEDPDDVYASLDAVRLQERVLAPALGITDPRTDPRLRYVAGGDLSYPEDHGCDVCFLMYPTPLEDVMRIADAGMAMPPKSTWFEPKAWGGLFVSLLD